MEHRGPDKEKGKWNRNRKGRGVIALISPSNDFRPLPHRHFHPKQRRKGRSNRDIFEGQTCQYYIQFDPPRENRKEEQSWVCSRRDRERNRINWMIYFFCCDVRLKPDIIARRFGERVKGPLITIILLPFTFFLLPIALRVKWLLLLDPFPPFRYVIDQDIAQDVLTLLSTDRRMNGTIFSSLFSSHFPIEKFFVSANKNCRILPASGIGMYTNAKPPYTWDNNLRGFFPSLALSTFLSPSQFSLFALFYLFCNPIAQAFCHNLPPWKIIAFMRECAAFSCVHSLN